MKRATYEDAAKKCGLVRRQAKDYGCCWPRCREERSGVTLGWGMCDKHDAAVYKLQDKMNEKVDAEFAAAAEAKAAAAEKADAPMSADTAKSVLSRLLEKSV